MKPARAFIILMGCLMIIFASCKKKPDTPEDTQKYGKINFTFSHKVNGQPLVLDTLMYVNTAGNQYMVNEIQYFISDVTLHKSDGSSMMIKEWEDIRYIDVEIPSTLSWSVFDNIPTGSYASISFTFGISEAKNQSYMYVNPPERDMFWPQFLGGGYHYMKLNGKWLDTTTNVSPFDFHMGIGQIYAHNVIVVDSITGFVQNYFTANLPSSSFTISENQTTHVEIIMNIESWFETPHVFDFNIWGNYIMQNQAAMQLAKENGADVFTTGLIQ